MARGNFGDGCGASHCIQCGMCCVVVQWCVERSSAVWGGQWGGPMHWYIRWGFHSPIGKVVLGCFLVHWFKWIIIVHRQKRNVFDSYVKSLQYFRTDNISAESLLNAVCKNVPCKYGMLDNLLCSIVCSVL